MAIVAVTTKNISEAGDSHDSADSGLYSFSSAGRQLKTGEVERPLRSSALPSGELTTDATDIGHEVDEPREHLLVWTSGDCGVAVTRLRRSFNLSGQKIPAGGTDRA
jgi:hypothetical protein